MRSRNEGRRTGPGPPCYGLTSVATFGVSVWTVEGSKRPQRSHPDMNEASTS